MKQTNDMSVTVDKIQNYVRTYKQCVDYENYSKKTYVYDMLYGVGTSLSDDYKFAGGFDQFKNDLIKFLQEQ
jgi:hypothetical protein